MSHYIFKFIFIFLIFGQLNGLFAQDTLSYSDLIVSADAYYSKNDYYNAKNTYQLALQLDPNAEYPKKRIEEIIQKLNLELEMRLAFEEKMQNAQAEYDKKNYQNAIAFYKEAASIIAYEEKPKQEIIRIEKEWEGLKSKQSEYEILFADAITAKQNKDYASAIDYLEQANKLFPEKTEALSEIVQLKLLLKQENERKEAFKAFVAEADIQFGRNSFQEALKNYMQASALFEDDIHVKSQLILVEKAIKIEQAYNKVVEKADAHYVALELDQAKRAYEEALKIWSEKTYPGNMLAKIEEAQQRGETIDQKKATGSIDIQCEVNENGLELAGAFIDVTENGITKEIAVSGNGKHTLKLNLNTSYLIKFKKEGYIHKIFSIDTQLPDNEDINTVFSTNLSVELFPRCSIDLSLFDKPLVNIAYERKSREFTYDLSTIESVIRNTEKLKKECAQEMAEIEKLKTYEKILAEALKFKNSADYSSALLSYQNASALFPDKGFPKEQIIIINALLKQNKEYAQIIANGDLKVAQGKFNDALFDYYKAKNLNPQATYPQEKITEIERILAAQNTEDKIYQNQLRKADSSFNAKLWAESIAEYETAISLKGSDPYPKTRVQQARQFLLAQNELDASYQLIIQKADAYFESQSFTEARKLYMEANRLKPNDPYPLYKIEDINTIVEQKGLFEINDRYLQLVNSADKLFAEKAYAIALNQYKQALALKPKEVYPPQQIAKINQILGGQNELEANYKKFIKSADSAFYLDDYRLARSVYLKAITIKPKEEYPIAQIKKIDALLADMNDLEQNYKSAIERADAKLADMQYATAKDEYKLALTYKPVEAYPKQKIKEIDALLAKMSGMEAVYQKAIQEGDRNFDTKNYSLSLSAYNEALRIKQNEAYPKSRILAIETVLAQLAQIEKDYNQALARADDFYQKNQYKEALPFYKQALEIKPLEKYPPDQINRINEILNNQLSVEESYNQAIAAADQLFSGKKYQEALSPYLKASQIKPFEKYPPDQMAKIRELLGMSTSEYKAFIKQGDDAYRLSNFQDAVLAYENALGIFPEEAYPKMMLEKIDAKIRRESVLSLVSAPETLVAGIEKRYTFKPIDYRDRQDNYILIEMKNASDVQMRVFINFGKDAIKNGGYAVNLVQRDGYTKYFVLIDRQLRWKSEDNNWIALIPEGGDLDVKVIQISREEKEN